MGGGPDKEFLLITNYEPEPVEQLKLIGERFPYIDITYHQTSTHFGDGEGEDKQKMADLYKQATILATLGVLPDKASDAPNLKLIHLFSAGVDHFSSHPIFTDSTIPITTSSGVHGPPIAEFILSSLLALSRHLPLTLEHQRNHKWAQSSDRPTYAPQTDWVGKRVGIAGYGSIGRQAARVITSLGASVIAYTASPRPTASSRKDNGYIVPGTGDPDGTIPTAWFSGTTPTALHTFLRADLDSLIVCLPLTRSTMHLFGTKEFEILTQGSTDGEGAYLVNISRGKIIKQDELVDALNGGVLKGAVLDVTDPEPLPEDDRLWDARNVVVSPHVSGVGKEYMERAYDVLMVNLGRWGGGEDGGLVNEVRRGRGY